jgi:hypothetical protein
MPPREPIASPPAADAPHPEVWVLLAAAVAVSLVLTPLGLLLALTGLVRERRARRDPTTAAFAAVAVGDLVVLAAVGLSLVVAAVVPLPR